MVKKLTIALEETLEVFQLQESEIQANKTGNFNDLYQTVKNDKENAKSEDEEADTESDDVSDDDEKPQDQLADDKDFSLESISNNSSDFLNQLKFLKYLGINLSQKYLDIATKTFFLLLESTARALFVSIKAIDNFINRSNNSISNLKEKVENLRKIVEELNTTGDKPKLPDNINFINRFHISNLSIGESVDLGKNLNVLKIFLQSFVSQLDQKIKDEIGLLEKIIYTHSETITNIELKEYILNKNIDSLEEGPAEGYAVFTDSIENYHYKDVLPGNILLFARLPKTDLENIDDILASYSQSKIGFGVNSKSFKDIDKLDYMELDNITVLLDTVSNVIDSLNNHKQLFDEYKKRKLKLRFSFKLFFQHLATAKSKTSVKDSIVSFINRKNKFIDSVYLTAGMDCYDYSAKVLNSVLSYVKKNLEQFQIQRNG